MPYSNGTDKLGVKLAPKLIQAVTQSVIATKKGLLGTEHQLRVGAMQTIIDRMGTEAAELGGPFITAALNMPDRDIHPIIRDYLESAASGQDQIKALSGIVFGGAASSLSQVISNTVAPLAYLINRHEPNLDADPQSAAQAAAQNIIPISDAHAYGADQGYNQNIINMWRDMAQNTPSVDDINQMIWRGFLTPEQAVEWLQRLAIPSELLELYQAIRPVLLTPADAALGVLRGDITEQQGYQLAEANGLSGESFDVLLLNTGEPLALEQLLEAYRREFIDENTLHRGVLQSRIRDEWWPTAFALRYEPLSTADAIQSSVQGYITKAQAKVYATQNGLNPDDFDAAWLAAGEPLSRTEMTDLVNRGFATTEQYKDALRQSRLKDSYIDLSTELIQRPMSVADAVESYVQGYLSQADSQKIMGMNGLRDVDRPILQELAGEPISKIEALSLLRRGLMSVDQVKQALRESRLKDKYINDVLELQTVYPGIYDIRLLVSEGAIDDAQAAKLLAIEGYPKELIAPLIKAFSGATGTASKAVTESMLADLYLESAISATEFTEMLTALGYSAANAALVLEVNQWKVELAARNSLLSRTRTLFVGNKITVQQAENDLTVALVPPAQITKVMRDWELEREATVKLLSEAQVVDAWNAGLFSDGDPPVNTSKAVAYLAVLGYSADDADILLELKNKPLFDGSPSGNASKGKKNTTGQGSS